jgi:hypothetical protein
MEATKIKVRQAVEDYKRLFPDEYILFAKQNRFVQDAQLDKFAQIKGSDFVLRKLFEIPENFDIILKAIFDEKDTEYWKSLKGATWFAKTFPIFKTPEKI